VAKSVLGNRRGGRSAEVQGLVVIMSGQLLEQRQFSLHNQLVGILLVTVAATVHGLAGEQRNSVPAAPAPAASAPDRFIPPPGQATTGRGNVRPALEFISAPERLILF
jgi:hypothetical protein